ncbi:MAG: ABC transporter ATP-binding protein [Mycobacteriales bacterium]
MQTTAPSAISVSDLTVVRGKRTVLKGLRCSIAAGSVTGLLGPSGCGKTTLLRAIVGAQQVRSGDVRVMGEPAGTPSLRRRVGYLTQAPSIYADLSVRDNVGYFAALYGRGSTNVDTVIDDVGLDTHRSALVGDISGGQRTRTSLACALIGSPQLLVLDEPTVGLDPVIRAQLWQQFRDLAARGVTLLVSSHVMDEARHCDKLLLMREGSLLADDTPAALLESTGTNDLETAFLRIIGSQQSEA